MNKKVKLFAGICIGALLIFIVYSFWIICKPKPLQLQGEVDATEVKIGSKLAGRIDSIYVHKGDDVRKGQLLFTLKSPEIEARLAQAVAGLKGAQAQNIKAATGARYEDIQMALDNYLKAQAASELAQKTFDRVNNLFIDGVVPGQKKDEAETQLKASLETENAAKLQWDKAKNGTRIEDKDAASAMVSHAQAVIDEVRSYLDETNIYAPTDGEISNIVVEPGELVSSGYPVVTLVNLKDSWVTFNIREDLLACIRKGSEFVASIPAIGENKVKLRVSYINALGSYATWNATKTTGEFDMKTFEVHAIPVEKTSGLHPGMSVLVDWNLVKTENKLK